MATQQTEHKPKRVGRPTKYPWRRWLRAKSVLLVRGTHFDCEPFSMSLQVRRKARELGVKRLVVVKGDSVFLSKSRNK